MKHPVLANRAWLIVWWLAWFLLAAGQSLLFIFAYDAPPVVSIADSLISLLIYSGLALSLWYPFRFVSAGRNVATAILPNLILAGVFTVGIWIIVTRIILNGILPEDYNYPQFRDSTLTYRIASGVFIYLLVMLAYFLTESLSSLSDKNAREARLESIVKETELRMLRSQINPHFLFNSLNSISSLTITDPEKARDMIVKLSEFMRYSLSRKDEQPVSLQSELDNLRLYLDIEKVRFGDRLITEEHLEDDCHEFRIPVLLLQPLYENAIKHGVYESTETVRIITRARKTDGFVEITISNNFNPSSVVRKGTGTGLTNVARRMELQYGNKASIDTIKEDGFFRVRLYIPVEGGLPGNS
ncbi:MAG TPA: histidine kinase [Bacteroidales bacterium]|nr:histidine kinase [Bacteroidales bacterium]